MPKLPDKRSNEEIASDVDKLTKQAEELKAKLESAVPGKSDGSTPLPSDRTASEATNEEIHRAEVIRDPWSGVNALRILAHPPGRRLQWINPVARERRGMRGWTAVSYDDPIGREIHLYISDPPSRMIGSSKMDNIVRRGDSILCWIDIGIFNARQQMRTDKANRMKPALASKQQAQLGPNGQTFGDGLQTDERPRERTAPGFISPQQANDYRRQAQGTVQDAQIATTGRRMFDPE